MSALRLMCLLAAIGALGSASAQAPSAVEIGPIQVYMTAEEAQAKIFPTFASTRLEVKAVPTALKEQAEAQLGRRFAEDSLRVHLLYDAADRLLGYAMVTEEIGKYRPITFMVGVDPQFKVEGAAVLIYRESRGGEIRRSRFLRQYRGKSSADPIRINRDIVNISGATMSVRALNFSVRKLLYLTQALYAPSSLGARR
jgi:Na+-translocating ferredoxin:NAD+ oxidoreductase RnfG subunit